VETQRFRRDATRLRPSHTGTHLAALFERAAAVPRSEEP
jgi:hypothetical protein